MLNACNFDVSRGTTEVLYQKVLKGFRDLGVRMLFIDEVQQLLNSQNQRILNVCRDTLKNISDTLRIPIILIGTEKADSVIKGDKQVLSRYPIIRMNRWKYNGSFIALLNSFERGLPLEHASNLGSKQISEKIYKISNGIIVDVANILTECSIEAIRNGSQKITVSLIKDLQNSIFTRF